MSTRYALKGKKITVGTTPVALGTGYVNSISFVTAVGNTGNVFIGDADVSEDNGYLLDADRQVTTGQLLAGQVGEQFDLSQIYVVGSAAGQIVHILYDATKTVAD